MAVCHLLRLPDQSTPMINRNMGAPTSGVGDVPKRLEDCVGVWSLLRFLVPALLGDPPDRLGHSWSFKRVGFRWPFALRDLNDNGGVRRIGIWLLPSREL